MQVLKDKQKTYQCVRANNDSEYMGLFGNYCKEHDTELEKTILKTPHHNEVAKRMNNTNNDRIKHMLYRVKSSKAFKGETLRTVVNVIDLSFIPLDGDVLGRVWKGIL